MARAAAREGAAVAVAGRRPDVGDRMLRATGAEAMFVRSDVADVTRRSTRWPPSSTPRPGRLPGELGRPHRPRHTVDTTPELFDAHIAVNLRGPFFTMQAVVRDMLARKAPGTIVNIISSSEHGGQSYLAPYVAAKAGLAGLTRNAAHAHRWDRIRINGLDIGWTETEGEDATQRAFHAADDTWRQRAAAEPADGQARAGRRDRRLRGLPAVRRAAAWSPARSSTGTRTSSADSSRRRRCGSD